MQRQDDSADVILIEFISHRRKYSVDLKERATRNVSLSNPEILTHDWMRENGRWELAVRVCKVIERLKKHLPTTNLPQQGD